MSVAYIEEDQIAAIQDMIALKGEAIQIDGKTYQAYVENGATSQDASEFGIDDFNDEFEVTIIAEEQPPFSASVLFRGRKGEVENIEPLGNSAYALTVSLYE